MLPVVPPFGPKKREQYLELLRNGERRGRAAELVGVDRTTVWRHQQRDEEFALACDESEILADEAVEDALYQAALAGNVVACQVWLYNRRPERWRDMRQIHARVEGETTVRHRHEIPADLDLRQLIPRTELPKVLEAARIVSHHVLPELTSGNGSED